LTTSIRLSPEISLRLDRLAEKTGRTKAFYLRLILESGISDLEDYYRATDALERVLMEQEKVLLAPVTKKESGGKD
jgi:RHH-type rel operon transcriptional repressor/antitoxin RelB